MRKPVAVIVTLAIVVLAGILFSKRERTSPVATQQEIAAEDSAVAKAFAAQNSNTVGIIASNFAQVQSQGRPAVAAVPATTTPAPAGKPTEPEINDIPPSIVLENTRRAIRQFGDMFGGNPVGTNPEITAELSGDNPKHINFINTEAGMRINQGGELVDSWGTPLFFHQISGKEMEIHSAGPDKVMWTSDDLVAR